MTGLIICPKCNHQFEATDAFREEVQKELNTKARDWQIRKEEEFKQKENQLQAQLQAKDEEVSKRIINEKKLLQEQLQLSIRKSVASDFENQLKLLQQSVVDNEEKLKVARSKELEFLQKEKLLKDKEAEMELNVQRQVMSEREKMKEQLQKEETEKLNLKEHEFELKLKEKDKQLDDQKKLVDEMKRKSEQVSMQLQGEVQELLLEDILRNTFPFDEISDVGQGVRGADCIQIVRNQFGNEAGKIIYESKRTKDFANDWIEKLKKDMRNLSADVAIIVTKSLPKDMERFGEKDGVYICTFAEVRSVALLIRNGMIKIADARKSQENKGDKMVMLYDYVTGDKFKDQWKAIREGFLSMQISIQRERDAMERLWKARETQLEKVLLNAAHIKGSIEGIADTYLGNLNLIDEDETSLLK